MFSENSEVYSEPSQKSNMDLFAKIFNYLGSEILTLHVENINLLFRYRIIGMLNISGVHPVVNFQGCFFFMKVNVFFF